MKHFHEEIFVTTGKPDMVPVKYLMQRVDGLFDHLEESFVHMDAVLLPLNNDGVKISQKIKYHHKRNNGFIELKFNSGDSDFLNVFFDNYYVNPHLKSYAKYGGMMLLAVLATPIVQVVPESLRLVIAIILGLIFGYAGFALWRKIKSWQKDSKEFKSFCERCSIVIRDHFSFSSKIVPIKDKKSSPWYSISSEILDMELKNLIKPISELCINEKYLQAHDLLNQIPSSFDGEATILLFKAEIDFHIGEYLNAFCIFKKLFMQGEITLSQHSNFRESAIYYYNETQDDSLLTEYLMFTRPERLAVV
ncbi:MAG: hypothetical protein MRY83_18970 [Flavobacteriales bacterium]|nr:hypothetical protein [Flavobacteriales bacterium]